MQEYLTKGKELLRLLINNGYEGYFVGEVVRNTIMSLDYKRVDVITDASLSDILRIFRAPSNNFPPEDILKEDENTIRVKYYDYNYYFHPFMSKASDNGKDNLSMLSKHYSKALLDDLSMKDFTINALAMSYNGKVTDAYNGCMDLKDKQVRTIANPKQRFVSHPIDILKGLVLESELNFNISDKTYAGMKKRSKLLISLDPDMLVDELTKLLNTPYAKKGLKDLVRLRIERYIPYLSKGIKRLARKYHKVNLEDLMLMSYVLNEELETMYDQRITNYEEFKMTYNVAMTNKKGKYDTLTLFSNGLNVCLRANMINHYLGRSRNKAKAIKKDYEKLVIKRTCDLAYKGDEILRITGINDTDMINDIMDEVILKILNKEIKNNHDDIEKEVIRILTDRGIYFDLNRELVLNRTSEELEIKENDDFSELEKELEEMKDNEAEKELSTEERLSVLEEKVDEQHKIILEKSEKIAELEKQKIIEVSSKLVNNNIDLIKRDGQINSMIDDLNQFELDLRAFLVDYLQKGKEDEED